MPDPYQQGLVLPWPSSPQGEQAAKAGPVRLAPAHAVVAERQGPEAPQERDEGIHARV